jgi:hypothetical protein
MFWSYNDAVTNEMELIQIVDMIEYFNVLLKRLQTNK